MPTDLERRLAYAEEKVLLNARMLAQAVRELELLEQEEREEIAERKAMEVTG